MNDTDQREEARERSGYMNTFYCNSSIESKKVLININTMPMLKSPLSTPPAPVSPHEERERKKEKKQNQGGGGGGHLLRLNHNMKKATT